MWTARGVRGRLLFGILKRVFTLKSNVDLFYVLAFLPLLLVAFFNVFGVIIPMFGFLLLLLRKEHLPFHVKTSLAQKALGLTIVMISFFLYYVFVPLVFPASQMAFFSAANYIAYIFGLCIIFFGARNLRSVFSPLFLMVASSSNTIVSSWLGAYLSPFVVPSITNLILRVLKTIGISAVSSGSSVITLQTQSGPLPISIVWSCVGVHSLLVFSIILVVILFDEPCGIKTKIMWSVIGVLGVILLNILRLTLIFITDYYYGFDAGAEFHYTAGYVLFMVWIASFLYLFQRREVLVGKVRSISGQSGEPMILASK